MPLVRIAENTKHELDFMKDYFQTKSYDETVEKMVEHVKKKISMFGADPWLPEWSEDVRKEIRFDRY